MALEQRPYTKTAESVGIDAGLRAYMLKVYNYMTTALFLTGFVAYFFGKASMITNDFGQIVGLTAIGNTLFNSPLQWVVMLAPLGLVFYFSFRINKINPFFECIVHLLKTINLAVLFSKCHSTKTDCAYIYICCA